MSSNKKSSKKSTQNDVRLSICMIAKNEEENIAKALESVKNIAYELIVVDTGSADKTVDVAKNLGADIYHFEWTDDFSAAKNYAIEKATGNWIMVLDADEYFLSEDAQKLSKLLNKIQSDLSKEKDNNAITCMLINLDDNGRFMTKTKIIRVFRNIPSIRYEGRIHERLMIDLATAVHAEDITLLHTGYSESAHKKKGNGQRNIEMLKKELDEDPGNLTIKSYLANSLSMSAKKSDQKEAESLITQILGDKNSKTVHSVLRVKMFIYMINVYGSDPEKQTEYEDMCRKALTVFPGTIDFEFFLAKAMSKKGDFDKAWELLKGCEEKLINNKDSGESIMIPADPTTLFSQMILAAKSLDDIENVILYSTHVLSMDKTRLTVLSPCIATLLHYGVTEAETIDLLSNIYDFGNHDDLQIVAKAASNCGATGFAESIKKLAEEI